MTVTQLINGVLILPPPPPLAPLSPTPFEVKDI